MRATLGHVGINLSKAGFRFWRELLSYLDFALDEETDHFHASDGRSYLCISVTENAYRADTFHRKRTGLNHVALYVSSPELVDQFIADFLTARNIQPLYGGARSYPEYVEGYYAVYFEDPDRIKVEVVCEPSEI